MADLVRESAYWSRQAHTERVSAEHVRQALREQVYRSDLVASRIRELIADGTLLISLGEPAIGCINGLAVANLGDYSFGWPARVTASVGIGSAGVINIERESRLSGRTFDKAMLILEGYLRGMYAGENPLALSASVTMEQNYGGITGDSATLAELLCVLSAIAGIPLRQDIAVTGSVNQRGQVQAIGAVNEKVEGFFDICQQLGLTGQQGVCVPAANVRHLVLRDDVTAAIAAGRFHVWPVTSVDEAAELFSGVSPGSIQQAETFHGRVARRLREMSAALKERQHADHVTTLAEQPRGSTPNDPRPALPGKQ
jgi:ATP-dependent Lon protease